MKNDEQGTAQKVARIMTMTRTRKGTRYRQTITTSGAGADGGGSAGVIDFDRPQRRVPVKHAKPEAEKLLCALAKERGGSGPLIHKTLRHRVEMEARKERRAALVSSGYDRATGRSVVRAVRRKMAGRWDGKPVYGGGAPRWESMAP